MSTRQLTFSVGIDYQALPEWRGTFGFEYVDVHQQLSVQGDGHYIELLRGDLDADEMRETWADAGNHTEEMGSVTVWVFHGDNYLDWDTDVTSLSVGAMNHAAILPDGTVAFTRLKADVRAVIEAAHGDGPALASNENVQALINAVPSDLVSIILADGSSFAGPIHDNPNVAPENRETENRRLDQLANDYGSMPMFSMVLLGETGG